MAPDLATYDVILVNSSAGKDSQAMLDVVVELATAAGVRDRIVVVHADLGRAEWQGTRELAERQAAHYGLPFRVVKRTQNDLLDHVAARGKWPSSQARYCTSDHKRGPIRTVITALVTEQRRRLERRDRVIRQVRVLNCLGLRAQESPERAKKPALERDKAASNSLRVVDTWLPIHDWTVDAVWARIAASGVEHHRAYDLGMPRLSCCFCVFAPKAALVLAGKHNRELLDAYVAVERQIGHTFRINLTLAEVKAAVERDEPVAAVDSWRM